MWDKIVLIVPTYGRSKTFLPRFIKSVMDSTSDKTKVSIIFVVNGSDSATSSVIIKMLGGVLEYKIITENLRQPHLAKYYNMAYLSKTHYSNIYGMVGDDMEIVTRGWEGVIINTVNKFDGIGLFYCAGDDRFNDALCVNLFVTSKYVTMCGGDFMCDAFAANGIDMVWQLAADACNNDVYIEDVKILHHQCGRDGLGWDETYKRLSPMRKLAIRNKDKEHYHATKKLDKLRKSGVISVKAVRHIQHKRPGRIVVSNGAIYTYNSSGEMVEK